MFRYLRTERKRTVKKDKGRVTVSEMQEGMDADNELWSEYINTIIPNDRDYMPYQRWLALELTRLRKANEK